MEEIKYIKVILQARNDTFLFHPISKERATLGHLLNWMRYMGKTFQDDTDIFLYNEDTNFEYKIGNGIAYNSTALLISSAIPNAIVHIKEKIIDKWAIYFSLYPHNTKNKYPDFHMCDTYKWAVLMYGKIIRNPKVQWAEFWVVNWTKTKKIKMLKYYINVNLWIDECNKSLEARIPPVMQKYGIIDIKKGYKKPNGAWRVRYDT